MSWMLIDESWTQSNSTHTALKAKLEKNYLKSLAFA